MKQLNDLIKFENLKSFEKTSIESFLSLKPMNKSKYADTMRHINHLVNDCSGDVYNTLRNIVKENSTNTDFRNEYELFKSIGTLNSKGDNFLNVISYQAQSSNLTLDI